MKPPTRDPWGDLRRLTPARIALGRAGSSLPTAALLEFGVAHAAARDAVHVPFDVEALRGDLGAMGRFCISVQSAVRDRTEFLRRPDLGRRLDAESRERLVHVAHLARESPNAQGGIVWVIADGLSARAPQEHAAHVLRAAEAELGAQNPSPIVIATQARVALGDEIGALLEAEFVVMMIGERPGLSSPDSLGIYLTRTPRVGCSDAERNCISNIRPEGLSYGQAAITLVRLIAGARRLGATGVRLKDEGVVSLEPPGGAR